MKKIMFALACAAAICSAKAACVDWQVKATQADLGSTVYLLTAIGDFSSSDDLIDAAISSSTVAAGARGAYATTKVTATGENVTSTSDFYYAILSADKKSYTYVDASAMAGSVYDPDLQQSSPGTFSTISMATIQGGTQGSFGAVPEPTSGLLLLLGMAGLALRRKQK